MGWFWQSSSSSKPEGFGDSPTPNPTPPARQPPATTASPTQTPPGPSESAPNDREMAMFLEMFKQDTQSSDPSRQQPKVQQALSATGSKPATTATSSSSSWLPWSSSPKPNDEPTATPATTSPPKPTRTPQSLAMSEHVLPSTMSCRDAFDYAWHCHTPGAQWNAVYRYGSVRSCSELWDDFWFCMRTKSYAPEMKAEAIREHYRAKEEAKYGAGKPSSEDVWQSRDERLPPGTAFQAKFDPPIVDDAEFQRVDAERRRRIRESVGIEGKDNQ